MIAYHEDASLKETIKICILLSEEIKLDFPIVQFAIKTRYHIITNIIYIILSKFEIAYHEDASLKATIEIYI